MSDFLHSIYTDTIAEERGERERFLKSEIPNFRVGTGPRGALRRPQAGKGRKGRKDRQRESRDAEEDEAAIAGDAPTGPADDRMPDRTGRARRSSSPRLPGMPEPSSDTPVRDVPAAPAFLSAFRADNGRPAGATNGLHRAASGAAAAVATMDRPAGDLADAPVLGGRYRTGRQLLEGAVESLYAGHDPDNGPRVLHVYKAGPPTGRPGGLEQGGPLGGQAAPPAPG